MLSLSKVNRLFKRLKDVWEVVSQDEFYLSDIFPDDQCTQKPEDLAPPKFPKPKFKVPTNIISPNRELQRTIQRMRNGITRITDEWIAEHSNYVVKILTPNIVGKNIDIGDYEEVQPIDIDIGDYWDFGTGIT